MEYAIWFDGIFKGRGKCCDKIRRKISDKTDSIIEKYFFSSWYVFVRRIISCFFDPYFSYRCTESCKKLIFSKYSFFRESIKKWWLPCIGIADNSDCWKVFSFTVFSMKSTSILIGFEFFIYGDLLISKMTFHDFCIRLTLSFCIFWSSSLARELHTHTVDTRSHMLDGCELDLELRFRWDRMKGKYLQYEIDSIPCLHLRFCLSKVFIHIIYLSWLHDIPNDQKLSPELFSESDKLIEFTRSNKGTIIWCSALLNTPHYRHSSIRRYKRFKFTHTVIELFLGKFWWSDIYNDSFHILIKMWIYTPLWKNMFYENLRPDSNKDDSPDDLGFISENMSKSFSDINSEETKNSCHDTNKPYCEKNIHRKKC